MTTIVAIKVFIVNLDCLNLSSLKKCGENAGNTNTFMTFVVHSNSPIYTFDR